MSLFSLAEASMFLLKVPPAGDGGGAGGMMSFLPLIAIIAIFYFLIIRPQSRKQKETQNMLSALRKGDRVVTIGGIHGVIQSVRESTLIIKVDENTKLEFSRSAVASIANQAKEDKEEKETKKVDENDNDKENS